MSGQSTTVAIQTSEGVSSSMSLEETPDRKTFQNKILDDSPATLTHAMVTCAQVGVGALLVFEKIFADRFKLLGIDLELAELQKSGL
jgi:hypothetical protein